ncbi:hypothetical protein N7486_003411 [Penicillium sp. IBT 16267x]|nr:hypothetical protein N7486_003411 [Penicillium sp. IBT 16267x]
MTGLLDPGQEYSLMRKAEVPRIESRPKLARTRVVNRIAVPNMALTLATMNGARRPRRTDI